MNSTTYACPNGHASSDPDYCSECGKKLAAGDALANIKPLPGGEPCPDCGTPRASPSAVFCEVCRYNFATKQPWSPDTPVGLGTPDSAEPPRPIAAEGTDTATTTATAPDLPRRWEAVVAVDPSLYADPDPANPIPVGAPERVFPIDFAENLIGRRSERRAIYPEIDLSGDSGISSRHALLYREADGALSILDVGSTNGTQVNGAEVVPGVRTPLQEGDQITAGCWTRIHVRVAGVSQ